MKLENYAIIADSKHEYDVIVIKTEMSTSYAMRYSNGEQWSDITKGQHILSATDDGDGIKFTEKIKRSMGYDNFVELRLFMEFIHNYDENLSPEYKTYKQIHKN